MRALLLSLLALSLLALPVGAQERQKHTDEWRPRIELSGQLLALPAGAKTKQGPASLAHTIHLRKDAHLPARPILSARALVELQTPIRIALGASWAGAQVDAPRRHVHYRGMALGFTRYPGGSPVRLRLDLQRSIVHARFVIFDDDRLHLSVGTGAAWASFRIGASERRLGHESRRVETVLGPTIGYRVSWRLTSFVSLFVESTVALLAPAKPSAILSETRLGAVWHLTDRVGLLTGVEVFSADLEDHHDRWGGRTTTTHRWEQASWTLVGLDVGLFLRF